jgi:hypothetical protein
LGKVRVGRDIRNVPSVHSTNRATRCALFLVAILTSSAASAAPRLGLVVAGGVSEGSYQAGASYVLLRHKLVERQVHGGPELSIATGASAGNINVVLASTFWLDRDALTNTSVTCNVFHDTWVDVGMDRLAPTLNDWASYRRLFEPRPSCLSVIRPVDREQPHADGDPVYTSEDALVTRNGILDVVTNAERRVDGFALSGGLTRWRQTPPISLGITITKETVDRLRLEVHNKSAAPDASVLCRDDHGPGLCVNTQREVLPFRIAAPAPATPLTNHLRIETVDDDWNLRHREIGSVLKLGPACTAIGDDRLFTAIKAAKGFPFAFGPIRMYGDKTGPRYWDGGWFDNVPVGLALAIDEELGVNDAPAECLRPGPTPPALAVKAMPQLDLTYVDASTRRLPDPTPELRVERGISYLFDFLWSRLDEGRNYELQRLARLLVKGAMGTTQLQLASGLKLHMTDRYFALVAEELPLSFGAFMQRTFRNYDYLVGVYDGLFAVALEQLEAKSPADADRIGASGRGLVDDDWVRFADEFAHALNELVCDPKNPACTDRDAGFVRDFVTRLLRTEIQERTPTKVDFSSLQPTRVRPDDPVWHVLDIIEKYRRTGHNDSSSFESFLRHLPKQEAVFSPDERVNPAEDPSGFWVELGDRLARRAVDIERIDRKGGNLTPAEAELSRGVETTLQVGRVGLISFVERSRPNFPYLDDSSSARRLGLDPLLAFVLPYYVATQLTSCTRELGWEPKIRSPLGWDDKDKGRQWPAGFFIAGQAALQGTLGCITQQDMFDVRFGVGLGYDPAGRAVDDIQLTPVIALPRGHDHPNTKGLELAATFLTKIRLAVGSQTLWSAKGEPVWYVSLGVADLGGLLTWGLDSALKCENRPGANPEECETQAP